MKFMKNFKSFFGHLKNIIVHKYWVFHFGRKIGVSFWQLLKHDLSKFSFIEFWESVKYYQGTSSPIPVCKRINGYSKAWQHHKGRNPHHYEYWTDNYDSGTTFIPIPWEYLNEMLADWCAAGKTYQKDKWSIYSQKEWWNNKKQLNPSVHPATIKMIDIFFECISYGGFYEWRYQSSNHKCIYQQLIKNV